MKAGFLKSILMYTAALSFVALNANAQDDIELGEPGYGGNGCPQGSVSATLSPDNKELSILFDEYIVEAGYNGKRINRKSCNMAIPVHVPQGYSIAVFQVDYRGFVSVPRGGMARYSVEYFFAGQRGPRQVKSFRGGYEDDYLLTSHLGSRNLVWSPCGADTNLRINTSMMARSNRSMDDVFATVDSADVSAGLVYHIQWRKCGGGNGGWD